MNLNQLSSTNYKKFYGSTYIKPIHTQILTKQTAVSNRDGTNVQFFKLNLQQSNYLGNDEQNRELKSPQLSHKEFNLKQIKFRQHQINFIKSLHNLQDHTPLPQIISEFDSQPYESRQFKQKLKSGRNLFSRIKEKGIQIKKIVSKDREDFIIKNSLKSKLMSMKDYSNRDEPWMNSIKLKSGNFFNERIEQYMI